jgi:hypothetical protein
MKSCKHNERPTADAAIVQAMEAKNKPPSPANIPRSTADGILLKDDP